MKYLSLLFFLLSLECRSQDLNLIKLTRVEAKKGVQYHYQWESTDGHVAVIDLFLFKNQTFEYSIASNVYNTFSFGRWNFDGKEVVLKSDFQKGTLPINVSYRQRDSSDFTVKEIAFVRDQTEKTLPYAFVYINNDSTSCMDGDLVCNGDYKKVERVKVVLDNDGPSSEWIDIKPHEGLIQITVLTKCSLENYTIINDRYKFENSKLKPLGDK